MLAVGILPFDTATVGRRPPAFKRLYDVLGRARAAGGTRAPASSPLPGRQPRRPSAVSCGAMADDAWVMYFVVRKDLRLDLPAAVALAGGATIACARRFAESHGAAFDAWRGSAVRKVAVRASAEELEAVLAAHEAVLDERGLACLPPLRRSDAGEPLASLPAFTDARRPAVPTPQPPSVATALTYVLNAGLGLSQGKAMAQAGHGALMCADDPRLGDRGPRAPSWRAWAAEGRPARVIEADAERFAAIRRGAQGAVVRDAGFTQVAPGTVTLVCLPPGTQAEPEPRAGRRTPGREGARLPRLVRRIRSGWGRRGGATPGMD